MKKYMLKSWWRYLIGGASLLASTFLDVILPMVVMYLVDDVIVGRDLSKLKLYILMIAGCAVGRTIFQYLKEFLMDGAGSYVAENLRKDLLSHITRLSKPYFKKNNTGEIMAHVKDDTSYIWDMAGFVSMLLVEGAIYFVSVLVCMIKLNFKLSLIPIVFLPILAVMVIRLEKKLDKNYDSISEENAKLTRCIEENISGVRTVKAFSAEEDELKKFDERNQAYNDINVKQARDMADAEPLIQFIPKLMQACVITVGGIMAIRGNITYGTLVAFMQYASNIVWPLENLGWMLSCISAGITGRKKINRIFNEKPVIESPANPVTDFTPTGALTFKNVSFKIDDTEILNNVSFNLEKGKTIGIMGATGAGKSSVVNLIERFYDVTDGEILVDGVNIKNLPLEYVRGFSSVVSQDVFLFSDTISDNVKLGRKKTLDDKTVRYAIEKAHAKEFVEKITDTYDAVIGERGIGLSGGQKQRLSIARALSRDSKLLIMDDSTSALDTETEAEIQQEIKAKKDMSKIIIGHRISSVKDADEIIVLDKGAIRERGTHEELMKKRGMYFATYQAQYGSLDEAISSFAGGGVAYGN